MRLILLHPKVATRDCNHCREHFYDEKTGLPREWPKGSGNYLKRVGKPPCVADPEKGCPKGTYENPIELSEQNWDAWQHYQECRAVGSFPDDAIVRRNARMIREIEDQRARFEQENLSEYIKLLASMAAVRH